MNTLPELQAVSTIRSYHAHVYFNTDEERARATLLRQRIDQYFPDALLGRWHDRLVGPHSRPMYQVAFTRDLFATFVPWLMLNRLDLPVLVHPNTAHPRQDHLVYALWFGEILAIRGEVLPEISAPTDID